MRFSSAIFVIAVASADAASAATAQRRTSECAGTIADGGPYSYLGSAGEITNKNCAASMTDGITYTATSCPGCTVEIEGKITFIEPPVSLGCNQDEVNAANPCAASSITMTSTEDSSMENTSTSTTTGSTETVSKCVVNGKETPCDQVPEVVTANTNETSGATAGAKIVSVSAIALGGIAFAIIM